MGIPKDSMFIKFLAVRLMSVYIVQTFFVPDEFWQSLEVAHVLTFKYGHLTWEWEKKIRSSVYPVMFHFFYWCVPDTKVFLIHAPRIFQALLSCIGDFYTYKLASKLFGHQCGKWTSFNILSSWFLFYCSPRTLTNMAEASLTACGLYLYPWETEKCKGLNSKYLWFAGASVLIRPTGSVLWIALYCYHIWREKQLYNLFKDTIIISGFTFGLLVLSDRYCYGEWVLTLYNFFLFNWTMDIGAFYGKHHFFWYFTEGLPVVLTTLIIPFLLGLVVKKLRILYVLVLWFILVFSILTHKEYRFLLPIMPICIIISSVVMMEISSGKFKLFKKKISNKLSIYIAIISLTINVPLSLYTSLYHQRGTIDVILHLSDIVTEESNILFLMPCHSTPYYSYVHRNITMKFLTCEPNLNSSKNYVEEADEFFQDPMQWLSFHYNELNDNISYPTHIIMFDTLYQQISQFLYDYKYKLCYRTFHSHFPENRRGKFIYIYCKN